MTYFSAWPLLSMLIWLPIGMAALVLVIGDHDNRRLCAVRVISLLGALTTLVLSVLLAIGFDHTTAQMQFVERIPWVRVFGTDYEFGQMVAHNGFIEYFLGIDGFSLPFIILTAFTAVVVVIAAHGSVTKRVPQYMAAVLLMAGLMNGVFAALDTVLFYVFWEMILIPMFLIIGIWGGPRRIYAAIKFFLYTFVGSVLMLVAFVYLYFSAQSFSILDFHTVPIALDVQKWLFIAFFLAFAVKIPMWPVHTWLPDAHVEAPTGGSVILAAVMLKMGGYGFLRFALPITPDAAGAFANVLIVLSLIAVVYIGAVALMQSDMKKLIAYSSIAHMGFVTLGTFVVFSIPETGIDAKALGIAGAVVQMISHGFISAALFFCIGVLYDRVHSRAITDYGGVAQHMPSFTAFAVFFAMANAGLPGTSGFVGEFMVIVGSFQAHITYAITAALTLILGAAYTLWMIKRVFFGPVTHTHVTTLTDMTRSEWITLGLLAAAVLALGIYPAPLVDMIMPSVEQLLTHIALPKTG